MLTPRSLRSDHAVSLWTRVVSVISFVLVAGTLVTGGLSLYLLHRTLLAGIDNDLQTTLSQVKRLDPEDLADDTSTPGRKIAPVDFIVEFRTYDGTVTGRAVQSHGTIPAPLVFPDLTREQVAELQSEPFTLQDGSQGRWRVMVVPDPEHDGMVFVALPMTSVDQTMHEMALIILLVGTAVVLAGMGIGGYVAHRALEPLRDVQATARQIAGGDLSRRVPVTGTSQEVQALAVSLNEMLVRIEQSFEAQSTSETRATASEARMRRFVGDASHELRTPLAAIRGFGELYRMGALATPEDVSQAMRRIEDEARRMGSLVENLLRLARLDDNPEPDLQPVDISDAIFDAAQDLRALDPDRRVMVVSLSGTPLTVQPHVPIGVMADEPSLRQVILNLVGNTNRHTPRGTPVELAAGTSRDGTVFLEVRDHGDGIPPDQRERVFERFYRTDVSRQRSAAQGGGAGLGLSIAATIVEQHKGRISIHQTPGGGATFRVELVAADIDAEHAVAPDQARALTRDGASDATATVDGPSTREGSPEASPDDV